VKRTCVRSALAAPHPLERFARRGIKPLTKLLRPFVPMSRLLEVAEEGLGRKLLHLVPRRAANRCIGRNENDVTAVSMLGRQAFENRVRVLGEANLERTVRLIGSVPVEDEHTARALQRNEAREPIAKLPRVRVVARVQQVVTVEEVQGRFGHFEGLSLAVPNV